MTTILLTLGMSGPLVRALHERLAAAGLAAPEAEVEREVFGPGTREALSAWQQAQGLRVSGMVDEETAAALALQRAEPLPPAPRNLPEEPPRPSDTSIGEDGDRDAAGAAAAADSQFLVRGQVMYRDGLPISGAIVRAFNKDLRAEELLAEAKTGTSGNFELWYSIDRLRRRDKRNADVVVRAYGAAEPTKVISTSRVIYSAQTVEKVRLLVDGGPAQTWSEYEQLVSELAPELEGTAIESLEESTDRPDVSHLAGRTGQQPQRIAALIVAHKLAARSGIPADVLYGMARMGVVTNLSSLLAQGPDVLRRVVEAGISGRLIPGRYSDQIETLQATIRQAAVRYAMEGSGAPGRFSLGELLAGALPDQNKRAAFFSRFVEHRGPSQDLWKALAEDPAFRGAVPLIQFTIQIGALSDNHLPLVQELERMRKRGEIKSLRDLARFDQRQWEEIVKRPPVPDQDKFPPSIAGDSTDAKATLYAATIRRIVEDTLPTEAVAHRAKEDLALPASARAFFANVTKVDSGFDLLRGNFREAVEQHPALLEGVADRALALSTAQAVQRVFRLAPRYESTMTLIAAGQDSAVAIAQVDRSTFVQRFSAGLGGSTPANRIYDVASQTAAAALNLLADTSPVVNNLTINVLPAEGSTKIPNFETLFGSLDLCACAACRSVFSPTAYFAEILAFLHERLLLRNGSPTNARDILFERRPDLGDIELTCDNTNVPLPYIDLVNELLENEIAPFAAFDLVGGFAPDLDARTISPGLRAAFAGQGLDIGDQTRVVVVEATKRWFVSDHARLYPIEKQAAGSLRVRSVAYQTKGEAVALAANPEHQNDAAYTKLRTAVYPWSLPFHLPWEETRSYLSHLGVARHELMEDLSPKVRTETLADSRIANEILELLPVERDLIIGGRPVRLATTGALATLSGTANVDGVNPAPGDLVLVKNQNAGANGLYKAAAATWTRDSSRSAYVAVQQGLTLAGSKWLLEDDVAIRCAPWDFWGLNETANSIEVFDPAHPEAPVTKLLDWLTALAQARVLFERAAVSYDELLRVLETRFVNPGGLITIQSADPDDPTTCDTSKLVLSGIDAAGADRIHRFVRLWRRLGWTSRELDQAIVAFGGNIDGPLLGHLSHLRRLRKTTGLPVESLLAFWTTIETRGEDPPSLYQTLFLNPTVAQPVDPAFALDGTELAIVTTAPADAKISRHTPTILAALGIAAADLTVLVARLGSDALTLANLSWLYRHVQLARAAAMTIEDLVTLTSLCGVDPFDAVHTESALLWLEIVASVRASGLSVGAVDYLLRHRFAASSELAPSEAATADRLDEIRRVLQPIFNDTAPQTDPTGARTRRELGLLLWPTETIAEAVELLAGRAAFEVQLSLVPAPLVVPPALAARVRIDPVAMRLRVVGPLTDDERSDLANASTEPTWTAAVDAIHAQPRAFVTRRMKAFVWPTFTAPLVALPAGLVFPPALRSQMLHDAGTGQLRFTGLMTKSERTVLGALSSEPSWLAAIDLLADAPDAYVPPVAFLGIADAAVLFDEPATPEERFGLVLAKLLPHLQTTAATQAVVRWLSETLALEVRMVDELVNRQVSAIGGPGAKAIADFLHPRFLTGHPSTVLTAAAFPAQFGTFIRLQKTAALLTSLRFTAAELAWLGDFGTTVPPRQVPGAHVLRTVRWLSFDDLPVVEITDGINRFASWQRLVALTALRDNLPHGQQTLVAVFTLARKPGVTAAQLWAEIAGRTGWNAVDVASAATTLAIAVPDGLRDETGLSRLYAVMRRLKQLAASAERCGAWASADLTADDARAMRNTVKARYAEQQWLEVAKPLRDVLREKQRAALVAYLVARPTPELGRSWNDVEGLYAHFLIDVQMAPCMLTSRIKQAISSVQLFIQRGFLNLEQDRGMIPDERSDAGWLQWRWMKSYRLWEANRKVFVYPENWIEPELRRDKTSLFKGLESSLLQGDVNAETAADAFSTYLEGLDGAARLEVAGLYQEDPVADQPGVLHVFARSADATPAYYYRSRIAVGRWTEWERIELDISERQIVPIVWNSRLFLFWPEFTETQDPQPISDNPTPPTKRWELQLAWSERRRGRWTTKKLTPQKIQSNLQPDGSVDHGKSQHTFRATFDGAGLRLWYEYDVPERTIVVMPPHGYYGPITRKIREATVKGWFFTGCDGRIELFDRVINGVFPPTGTSLDAMYFTEIPSSALYLPKARAGKTEDTVLTTTPGIFKIAYAHQDGAITAQRPFFYQDATKSFFVTPEDARTFLGWAAPARVHLGAIDVVHRSYYRPQKSAPPPSPGRTTGMGQPVPVVRHRIEARRLARRAARAAPPAAPIVSRTLAIRAAKGLTAPKGTYVLARGDRARLKIADYIDDKRLFAPSSVAPVSQIELRYRFWTFYHPFVCDFIKELNWHKIDGLFERELQLKSEQIFKPRYSPTALVDKGDPIKEDQYPLEDVDFSPQGTYSQYNWELFFHAPLLIATRLMQNQRFEEAQAWFHYIFDPTDSSGHTAPPKYWRTRPFFETSQSDYLKQRIDRLIELAARGVPDQAVDVQVREWRENPFDPHAIACLRTTAYQKAVVMKYLDNLIAWGDQLFRRNTIETINEATQLYVLAAEILGREPARIVPRAEPVVHTYTSLAPELKMLSNKLAEIEQTLPPPHPDSIVVPSNGPPLAMPKLLYFCVPPNEKLLGYWQTVADRLYKIRHCLNIEGTAQRLPLFESAIDPALLVRAAAAGVDLTTALSDIHAALPLYRFRTLSLKASELAQEVKSLAGALLVALEKRDAEALAVLRARQETGVLEVMTDERERQVEEATRNIAALRAQRDLVAARYVHYQKLMGVANPNVPDEGQSVPDVAPGVAVVIGSEDGLKLSQFEREELDKLDVAQKDVETAAHLELVSSLLSILPTVSGHVKPWGVGLSVSGQNLAGPINAIASHYRSSAAEAQHKANRASRLAGYLLRESDWALQSNLAGRELMQIDAQILSAQLREQIANGELESHKTRIEQAKLNEEFLRDKYTNRELFEWMVGQVAGVFFQAYQLAYDVAKQAERTFRFELALDDSNFVQFGYWDSLRKGLLSGERLLLDIKRMEVAYFEQNWREYELTKHISLALLHPEALVVLKKTGTCVFQIPEAVFDIDNAGHYMRRLKAVTLTLPCVAGPYTTVSCKLTLVSSRIRNQAAVGSGYAWSGPDDPRFVNGSGGVQSIVTSSGNDDSGTFALDERDERYLPFEGAGAISSWRLELPSEFRQFDYQTISDVVLRLRYTARDGGEALKQAALLQLTDALKEMELEEGRRGLFRLFSLQHDFPNEWHRFLRLAGAATPLKMILPLDRFPMALAGQPLKIQNMALFARLAPTAQYDDADRLTLSLRPPGRAPTPVGLAVVDATLAGLPAGTANLGGGVAVTADESTSTWELLATALPAALSITIDGQQRLDPAKVLDVGVLCRLMF